MLRYLAAGKAKPVRKGVVAIVAAAIAPTAITLLIGILVLINDPPQAGPKTESSGPSDAVHTGYVKAEPDTDQRGRRLGDAL